MSESYGGPIEQRIKEIKELKDEIVQQDMKQVLDIAKAVDENRFVLELKVFGYVVAELTPKVKR